ncbi:MAG: methyl-accepting chemotaxis protein [Candidatus Binatia bacterium]
MKTYTAATGKKPSRDPHLPSIPSKGWRQFLKEPTVQLITTAFLVGMCVLWWQSARFQKQLVETIAIEQARSYAYTLQEVSSLYMDEIDTRAKTIGADLPADHKKKLNLFPNFSALLTKSSDKRARMRERFYSLESTSGQGGEGDAPDDFIRRAWTNSTKSLGHELTQFEEIQGQPTLRYAIDWKGKDEDGILEILVPLDDLMASSGAYGKTLFGFFAGFSVVGVWLMGMMLGKTRRDAKASELQVLALESEFTEQEKIICAYERERNDRRRQEEEILHAVNILAAVTGDLRKTTSELASGATEMAAAVNETTATVEEVKQTAALSSQKAQQVSASAHKAAQISQTGKQATEDTIAEMQRIRDQMQAIAESIMQLSEQSHAIREIIDAVNDLAEQSNVLAVNASIEAQKAGVHGSGFVVVAQEVRSLAQQSKDATSQVQTILNDIEKATGAAVQMTARGAKATEVGMKQSVEAGESIRTLTHTINEAAQSATLIATSNQQQAIGMDQLVQAMRSMQEGSEQTVTSAQQVETCVRQLQELEQRLASLSEQLAGVKRKASLSEGTPVAEAA